MKQLIFIIGIVCSTVPVAAMPIESSAQKQQELKSLRTEINRLKGEINKTEANKSQAMGVLQQSESAISTATIMLNDLQQRQIVSQAQLNKIIADMKQVKTHILLSQQKIADILKTRYQTGHYDAWRLILNQQNPHTLSRDLHYYTYIVKAQQKLADALREQLRRLDNLAEAIRQKQLNIQGVYTQKQQQRRILEAEKHRKAAALVTLSKEIKDKKSRLQRMQTDEKNLTYLVKRLNRILEEEARKRAQEQARLEKMETAEGVKIQPTEKWLTDSSRSTRRADQTEKVIKRAPNKVNQQIPHESLRGYGFTALKGRLRLPVSGVITGRFGEAREEGSNWKGVFIRANIGQSVKAISDGRVVFAEWLRGFGNMMIVDHGGGYMSLYGYNESLLKRAGDSVKAGEEIATVGDSGGSKEIGVYFEIRHHGQPQNPLIWAPAA